MTQNFLLFFLDSCYCYNYCLIFYWLVNIPSLRRFLFVSILPSRFCFCDFSFCLHMPFCLCEAEKFLALAFSFTANSALQSVIVGYSKRSTCATYNKHFIFIAGSRIIEEERTMCRFLCSTIFYIYIVALWRYV